MAWEDRNGKRYYYRKRWQNGKVVSSYVGTGLLAELSARMDDMDRADRERTRIEQEREREEFMEISRKVDQVSDKLRSLTGAALLSAGYYMHRGQWRRHRE